MRNFFKIHISIMYDEKMIALVCSTIMSILLSISKRSGDMSFVYILNMTSMVTITTYLQVDCKFVR